MKKEAICFLHTDHTEQIAIHELNISIFFKEILVLELL